MKLTQTFFLYLESQEKSTSSEKEKISDNEVSPKKSESSSSSDLRVKSVPTHAKREELVAGASGDTSTPSTSDRFVDQFIIR